MSTKIYRETCRYFNGIQHKRCEAGAEYANLRRDRATRLPCIDLPLDSDVPMASCELRSLFTYEEHEVRDREVNAIAAKAIADVASGKCHVCGADIEPSKVVGRCKYAACGHRIGQVAR